jgi:ubiquinone/menaquinone biosynthesis C-methylase UbiE
MSLAAPTRDTSSMKLKSTEALSVRVERDWMETVLPLGGARVLELGCGKAETTRVLAERHPGARFIAMEVDQRQHALNLASDPPANLRFVEGGAQAIVAPDAAFDVVLMLKSLHHVPGELLPKSFEELHRVLRPEGLLYIAEPVFDGPYNEVMRVFHDEQRVREGAFAAMKSAIERGLFELVGEHFFANAVHFDDFAHFERRMIGVTHTEHRLTPEQLAETRRRFEQHLTPAGADFRQPMRVDLLRRVG